MTDAVTPGTVTVDLTGEQAMVLVEAALFTVTRSEASLARPELANELVAAATILQEAISVPADGRRLRLVKAKR